MPNLFHHLPTELPEELVEVLVDGIQVRIERIVSTGHASPSGFWYDQDESEWVVLLQGAARLQWDGATEPLDLAPGDWVNIPAGVRHRVQWTTAAEPTVWLAVFYSATDAPMSPSNTFYQR